MTYHNTNDLSGQTLIDFEARAGRQQDIVYQAMLRLGKASPSKVWKDTGEAFLLTSIRRSLSDLTHAGKLVKTNEKTISVHGGPEHVWTLKPKEQAA